MSTNRMRIGAITLVETALLVGLASGPATATTAAGGNPAGELANVCTPQAVQRQILPNGSVWMYENGTSIRYSIKGGSIVHGSNGMWSGTVSLLPFRTRPRIDPSCRSVTRV